MRGRSHDLPLLQPFHPVRRRYRLCFAGACPRHSQTGSSATFAFFPLTRKVPYHQQVSPTLLAFFLAPIASEAPEILESISLSRKGHPQSINVAFSNLVGGTLSKTTLLCAVCYKHTTSTSVVRR